MPKTIEQIQTMITNKADAREVINEMADYLQLNPNSSSGGTATLQEDILYAALETKMDAGELVVGRNYLITDAAPSQGVDFGILLKAATVNSLEVGGAGGFLNADFEEEGDYTNVPGYTLYNTTHKNGGIWINNKESILINGNVIIWDCKHWVVSSALAFDGTDPATNTTAYTLLPKSAQVAGSKYGYEEYWDFIIFCFEDNFLSLRQDDKGNTVTDTSYAITGSIQNFQWGRKECLSNVVENEGKLFCLNALGFIEANKISAGGSAVVSGTGNLFYSDISIGSVQINGISAGINYLTLRDNSSVTASNCTASIDNCHLIKGATLNMTGATGSGVSDFANNFINGVAVNLTGHNFVTPITNQNIQAYAEHADNTAAVAAGLLTGASYRVTGTGDIKTVI